MNRILPFIKTMLYRTFIGAAFSTLIVFIICTSLWIAVNIPVVIIFIIALAFCYLMGYAVEKQRRKNDIIVLPTKFVNIGPGSMYPRGKQPAK